MDAFSGSLSHCPPDDVTARKEDARLLAGRGDFVAGKDFEGQWFAKIVRSAQASARLVDIDLSAAAEMSGVHAIVTAADLPPSVTFPDGGPEPVLATNEVRYVGQPIAMVLAMTRAIAEDAAASIDIDYQQLPVDGLPGDASGDQGRPPADPVAVFRQDVNMPVEDVAVAAVVEKEFIIPRQTGMPLETRGLLARWTASPDLLTIYGMTKHPAQNRAAIADALKLTENQIVSPNCDIGGSFGVKGELYPEDLLIPWAAHRYGATVKWIEDRQEHLHAINHSRAQRMKVRMSAAQDGRIVDVDLTIDADVGAYVRPLSGVVPYLASAMFPGPYRFPRYRASVRCWLTNRTPTGTMRAPGRVEANFVRERMLDMLAGRLGLTPSEIRLRNLLSAADLPYDTGTINEGPVHYEAGDFRGKFAAALRDNRRRSDDTEPCDDGLRCGKATVPFVEKAGLPGREVAALTVTMLDGEPRLRLDVASAPSGQGHETSLSRIVARQLGAPVDEVEVHFGDSSRGASGIGTFASRSGTYTGSAVHRAAEQLTKTLAELAGATPECDARVEWPAVNGKDGQNIASIADCVRSNGGEIAVHGEYDSARHTYPFGTVTCHVTVDPEMLTVTVNRLALTCDVGEPIDRDIVIGQLIGGAAQGIGGALLEELAYDQDGNPLASGLAEYLVPHAADLPDIDVELFRSPDDGTPDTAPNPLMAKGIGEAGIAAVAAACGSAICNAIPELTEELTELPMDPSRLWGAQQRARGRRAEKERR